MKVFSTLWDNDCILVVINKYKQQNIVVFISKNKQICSILKSTMMYLEDMIIIIYCHLISMSLLKLYLLFRIPSKASLNLSCILLQSVVEYRSACFHVRAFSPFFHNWCWWSVSIEEITYIDHSVNMLKRWLKGFVATDSYISEDTRA